MREREREEEEEEEGGGGESREREREEEDEKEEEEEERRERDRQTETETERDRQTQRERDREKETETERERERAFLPSAMTAATQLQIRLSSWQVFLYQLEHTDRKMLGHAYMENRHWEKGSSVLKHAFRTHAHSHMSDLCVCPQAVKPTRAHSS